MQVYFWMGSVCNNSQITRKENEIYECLFFYKKKNHSSEGQ